ncbi:hypothetical protein MUB04_14830 [Acinetobacter indicus]|uniref:hypothetical protein n=1 Tax=Acinetobacter TaxID=469 RepID=UPI0015D36606|nr:MULTISPECIES: hypothetical protein [Acinetobacter]MCP0917808.1 hypothetical protein [Acinetobacter indicus]
MIKNTTLTHAELLERISYSRENGSFVWTDSEYNGNSRNKPAGSNNEKGMCRVIQINGERWTERQLAWFWVKGEIPQGRVKPIDGNPRNCKFDNLKYVPAQNKGHKHIHYGGDEFFNIRKDGVHYGKSKTLIEAIKIRDSFPELLD